MPDYKAQLDIMKAVAVGDGNSDKLLVAATIMGGTIIATNSANGTPGTSPPAEATQVAGSDGTNLRVLKTSSTGVLSVDGSAVTQPVSATSLPLPTGASTSANQATEITALGTINTTLGTPFQAGGSIGNTTFASTQSGTWVLGSNSGVDIGDVTINNSTGTSAVNIQDGGNSITVDGPLTDTQLRATPVPVSGTITATPTGTQDVNLIQISGTTILTGNGATGAGSQRVTIASDNSAIAVTGPLTDTQLRATAVPVSGTVTANAGSGTFTVGQATGTNLHTVVDSGTVAATQSGTWTVQPGNTANTTAWKVDGSDVTQPVSGTVTSKVSQTTFVTGAKSSIGTSAVQITTTSTTVNEGVCVKADSTNTGVVYVGLSTVTNGTTDATDGFQIKSGESITVEVDNPNKVYVIASAASQKVYWVGV